MTDLEPEPTHEERQQPPAEAPVDAADTPSHDPASGVSPVDSVPAVDDALAEVEGVEGLPLEERLAAFERAHDRLRSALDSEPSDPA